MRMARNLQLTVAGALLLVGGLIAATPAVAANGCIAGFSDQGGGTCSRDLVVTSSVVAITVPTGVTSMTFDVRGAEGGTSNSWWNGNGSPGGKGGRQLATVPVTPGDTLQLVVGEAGGTGPVGGFGGGGQPSSNQGGAGGGGSFVFDGSGNPLVVAGGGGGGGFDYNIDNIYSSGTQQAPGGSGAGAANATDGKSVAFKYDTTYNPPQHFPPGGGGGASTSGPGAAGHSAITPNYVFGQVDGIAGSGPAQGPLPSSPTAAELALYLGAGGNGVHGTCCHYLGHAGGGGGGYYGGGSGGSIEADYEGGGGGGGSGYVVAGATGTTSSTGTNSGDGSITVSYQVAGSGGGGGAAGAITSFSPASGGVGTVVTISGTNLGKASTVRFNGVAGTSVKTSAGGISAKVPAGASSGKITVVSSTGTFTSTGSFSFVPAPTATGISPSAGSVGMQVTLTGTNLAAVSNVKVGAVSTSPDSTSATSLTFTIPAGAAASSVVSVTSPGGTAKLAAKLSVVPVPVITSISPSSAKVGAQVTVLGTGLAKASSVTIGGVTASYKLTGSTKVTVTVPAGATTGRIEVTTAGGTATGPTLVVT